MNIETILPPSLGPVLTQVFVQGQDCETVYVITFDVDTGNVRESACIVGFAQLYSWPQIVARKARLAENEARAAS